jgi:hypothetical protein
MRRRTFAVLLTTLLASGPAAAQLAPAPQNGSRLGARQEQRWQVGLVVTAPDGRCGGIFGTVPVPSDWPEQQVRIVEEEISPNVTNVDYRTLENGVKQMVVRIADLAPRETATALVTFEVTKSSLMPPEAVEQFVVPRNVPRESLH